MSRELVAAVSLLITMGVLDAVWLATMTSRLYRAQLGELLLPAPQWLPALAFYVLYAVGAMLLVALPALREDWTLARAATMAALLGLVAYGTYDLTNAATIRGWSNVVTLVDMVWGASLTATSVVIAVAVARRLGE